MAAWLVGSLGVLGLVLGAVGLYGVLSLSAARRTREAGIRLALGAGRRDVLMLILGQGMWLWLVGAAVGLIAASWVTRILTSRLYGVSPWDPATFALVAALLALVAELPISTWHYRGQGPDVQHIGPMAEDFNAAFGVGEDVHYISGVDADGVSLAAVQGLYRLVQEQAGQLADQEARIRVLEARLETGSSAVDDRQLAIEGAMVVGIVCGAIFSGLLPRLKRDTV